ncbi:MAG: phospholipase D-like domain-containing protein [Candidatus Limivivens sp.]|nr:phospholipase D-like domain-containing protein [Candidatus Limivivens sp.]
MKRLKKHPVRKALFFCGILLLIYIAAFTVPYIPHRQVPQAFRTAFSGQDVYGNGVGPERVAYIEDNLEALLLRFSMMEEAREELILSTFDFRSDESGKDIMAALIHAADRGVQVRVIIDGFSGFLSVQGDPYFAALAGHENIEVRIYNPVDFFKPWKMQARLHDKYLIVDDSMYLLGGRNTYDLFLGEYSETPNIDRELLVIREEGSSLKSSEKAETASSSLEQVRAYFERVWVLPDSRDLVCRQGTEEIRNCQEELKERYEIMKTCYPSAWEEKDWRELTMETRKVTLLSNPVEACNKEPLMWYCLTELMKTGDQVTIYTPYIICGTEMYEDLEEVCRTVSSLEIFTNDVSSGANPWGCTDYMNQKEKIWATGARVYEYLGQNSNHTKVMIVDDRLSVVGSYNMDMRSTYQDTELMLAVDCPELNAIIRQQAEQDKTYSRIMVNGAYQAGENYQPVEESTGKRIFYAVFRVLIRPIRRFL